jgi:hypothetical protein
VHRFDTTARSLPVVFWETRRFFPFSLFPFVFEVTILLV